MSNKMILPGRSSFFLPEANNLNNYAALDDWVWQDYTPVLSASVTDPTLGTGSVQQGRYLVDPGSEMVVVRWFIQFGSSGAAAGDGEYQISVPINISSTNPSGDQAPMGFAILFDWSVAGHKELAMATRTSATQFALQVDNATVFHNNPFNWTNDDRFGGMVFYEQA